jgi:hypothetical protein
MQPKKRSQIGNRLAELGLTRAAVATLLGVNLRTVFKWLAYETELRLSPSELLLLCSLLQWRPEQLATAYEASRPDKKKRPGAAVAPGQISLLP